MSSLLPLPVYFWSFGVLTRQRISILPIARLALGSVEAAVARVQFFGGRSAAFATLASVTFHSPPPSRDSELLHDTPNRFVSHAILDSDAG